jgi:hypothetical protein
MDSSATDTSVLYRGRGYKLPHSLHSTLLIIELSVRLSATLE